MPEEHSSQKKGEREGEAEKGEKHQSWEEIQISADSDTSSTS